MKKKKNNSNREVEKKYCTQTAHHTASHGITGENNLQQDMVMRIRNVYYYIMFIPTIRRVYKVICAVKGKDTVLVRRR